MNICEPWLWQKKLGFGGIAPPPPPPHCTQGEEPHEAMVSQVAAKLFQQKCVHLRRHQGGGVSKKSDSVGGFGKPPIFQKWSVGGF